MTTPNEDEPEPLIVAQTQASARALVQSLCDYLGTLGWDFALVSVSRRIDVDRARSCAPGATGMHCNTHRMKEALGTNASTLRKMADSLDEMVDTREATGLESYVQDLSRQDHREWPR